MSYPNSYDVEKNQGYAVDGEAVDGGLVKRHGTFQEADGAVPGESFEYGDTMYAKLQRLAGRFKIEQRGIERVPEDERTDTGFRALLNVSTMVCAKSMGVTMFAYEC